MHEESFLSQSKSVPSYKNAELQKMENKIEILFKDILIFSLKLTNTEYFTTELENYLLSQNTHNCFNSQPISSIQLFQHMLQVETIVGVLLLIFILLFHEYMRQECRDESLQGQGSSYSLTNGLN